MFEKRENQQKFNIRFFFGKNDKTYKKTLKSDFKKNFMYERKE